LCDGAGLATFCSRPLRRLHRHFWLVEFFMSLAQLSDESVRILYESIRKQIAEDITSGVPERLMGEAARQREEQLREEMDRRHMRFTPIDWPG
jgi:hypothetical protein